MIYNYHTHTTRCHHAQNSDEEYIKCAIEAGIKYLGFSDHAPFIFPDGSQSSYRVDYSSGLEYVKNIRSLAEKYKDEIQILVGFEMEYYPSFFEEMLKTAKGFKADYLILGQHFIGDEYPNGIGSRGYTENEKLLTEYVDNIIAAMRSGVFSYVAHPDIIGYMRDDTAYRREMTKLCLVSKELSIPLEINLHGLRNKRHYPNDRFFAIAGEIGSPVTLGFDAHDSEALLDTDTVALATDMIKRNKLNYIGMPKLINIG